MRLIYIHIHFGSYSHKIHVFFFVFVFFALLLIKVKSVNQTNIGTVAKATLGKLLRDGVERIWTLPSA